MNQSKVLQIGRVMQVPVEVEVLRKYAEFKVIEIVDEKKIYPTLLGIDCVNSQPRYYKLQENDLII